ncbi:MAG: hypothetical protein A2033_15440 [Bacteroidetes bacterium GWA2_31_9]|nr:MAG: hypothetical protein A2033_15440 [Bacteroidetes bacterium GWA2_31_9]
MGGIVKNTLIYTIGRILPQLSGFILLPIYTNYLTPDEYGAIQSMQVIITVLAIFLSLATERSMSRLYFDYNDIQEQKKLIGNATLLVLFLSSFCVAIMFLFKDYVSSIYQSIPFYPFYYFAILNTYILVFSQLPKVILQVQQKAMTFFIVSILQFFSGVAFILYFLIISKEGAAGMLKGQMLGNLVVLPIFLYFILKQSIFKIRFDMIRSIFSYSLPIVPSLVFAWVMNLSDRIFIERYFSLYDVGIYSLGYKIAGISALVTSSFYAAYSPIFYKIANDKSAQNPKEVLRNYNHTYVIIVIFLSFSIAFVSKEFIAIFLNIKYVDAWKIVNVISFSYLIAAISGLLNLMIYQEKKTMRMLLIIIISASTNTGMNFLIIPAFGAMGAAIATVTSSLVFFLIAYVYAKKFYFVSFHWDKILIIILPLIGIATINFFIEIPNNIISLIIKGLFLIALMWILFVKNKKQILAIVNSKK